MAARSAKRRRASQKLTAALGDSSVSVRSLKTILKRVDPDDPISRRDFDDVFGAPQPNNNATLIFPGRAPATPLTYTTNLCSLLGQHFLSPSCYMAPGPYICIWLDGLSEPHWLYMWPHIARTTMVIWLGHAWLAPQVWPCHIVNQPDSNSSISYKRKRCLCI